jgi:serine/threonine protein kinase
MAAQTPSRKYRIERYLAEGGMGAIYVGKKIGPGGFEKEVVLKQLLPEFTSRPEFRDLFFREAKISATLDHQNIVRTFDLVNSNDRLFIVMEYVRGADLRTIAWRARRRKPLSVPAILHVALEILAGLAYAHSRRSPSGEPLGIIHRDLSPSNILCSGEGEVKLSDFGIAKAVTYSSVFYRVRGKVGYMSPEMARNQPIDARSDLFSLGVSIYETLIGERIYTGDLNTPPDKIYAQVIPRLEAKCPGLPPELQTVLDRALAIDRNDRFPNAESFATALRQVAIDHHLLYSAPELATELREIMGSSPEHWLSDQRDVSGIRSARAAQAQDALAGNDADSVVEPDAPPASRTGDSDVEDVATPPARPSTSMAARRSASMAAVPARPSGSLPAADRPLAPITALPPPLPPKPIPANASAPPAHDPADQATPPPPAPLPPAVSMLERPHRATELPFGLRQVHDVLRSGGVAASRRSFRGIWLALFLVLAVLLGFALVRFWIAPSVGHAQGGSAPVRPAHRQQPDRFGHGHAAVLAQDHRPALVHTQ